MKYELDKKILTIKVNVKATIRDAKTGRVKRVKHFHNTVATVGKNLIAQFLGSVTPTVATLSPNYCAVGTGVTAPAASDVQLQTETARTVVSSRTSSGAVAYLTGYFGATDVSGTLKEAGLFIGATVTANSGTLLDRTAINVTKAITETLTLDFTITVS